MPSLNIGVPSLSRALWTVVKCQSRTFHIASTARSSASSSASAALRSTLDRIQEIDGELNAVTVTFSVEELEKEAAAIDALSSEGKPLHGVPVLIKDALNVKGLQTTLGRSGSPKFDEPKATDAVVVTRLRDAGALVVGKTNMPRDGMDVQTFNSRFGVTGNVFALQRTSGGSSGGSAVAVASGMVPLAIGTDIGGSLRIPAAWAGIYSIRPTPARVSTDGHIAYAPIVGPGCSYYESPSCGKGQLPTCTCSWHEILTAGALGRDVKTLERFMQAAAEGFPTLEAQDDEKEKEKTFKILLTPSIPGFVTDDRVAAVAASLSDRLTADSSSGAAPTRIEVVDCPEGPGKAALRAAAIAYGTFATAVFKNVAAMPDAKAYIGAVALRDQVREALRSLLDESGADAWAVPATSCLPFEHNPRQRKIPMLVGGEEQEVGYWTAMLPYIQAASVAGTPVVTVPAGFADGGGGTNSVACTEQEMADMALPLPVGMQLIGRRGEDEALLRCASAFETVLWGEDSARLPRPSIGEL